MTTLLAVNGTLMRGLELNGNLLAAGASFVREARTAPVYRLWSVGDRHPAMMRVASGGAAIALEVWSWRRCEAMLCDGQRDITQHGGWRAYLATRAATRATPTSD